MTKEVYEQALGKYIRDLREYKGWSQKELGEGICSDKTIMRLERGEKLPQNYTLNEILRKLGKSTEEWLMYIEKDSKTRFDNEYEELVRLIFNKEEDEVAQRYEQLKADGEAGGYYYGEEMYYRSHLACLEAWVEKNLNQDPQKACEIMERAIEKHSPQLLQLIPWGGMEDMMC